MDEKDFATAEGIGSHLGSYREFYEEVLRPRREYALAGAVSLPTFCVMGRYFLAGNGETYRLARNGIPATFRETGSPSVISGDEFLAAWRKLDLSNVEMYEVVTDDYWASLRAPDDRCQLCAVRWADTVEASDDYAVSTDALGAHGFTHRTCALEGLIESGTASCEEMCEQLIRFLRYAGFGEDLHTSITQKIPSPDLQELLETPPEQLLAKPDFSFDDALDTLMTAHFTVTCDIGAFTITAVRNGYLLDLTETGIAPQEVFSGTLKLEGTGEAPQQVMTVALQDGDMLAVLCVALLKRDRAARLRSDDAQHQNSDAY